MDGCEVGLVGLVWWWCGVSPGRYDEDDDEEESIEKAESEAEERREERREDDDDDDEEIEKEEKEVGEVPPTRSRRRPCRWCGPFGK